LEDIEKAWEAQTDEQENDETKSLYIPDLSSQVSSSPTSHLESMRKFRKIVIVSQHYAPDPSTTATYLTAIAVPFLESII
jgi:hypothetical protein